VVVAPHKPVNEERDPEPGLLTAAEVARLLHCNTRTLRRWRHEGRVPAPITMGARPRWRAEDIRAWIAARKESR
jgi:excisionase family DNA binding protein